MHTCVYVCSEKPCLVNFEAQEMLSLLFFLMIQYRETIAEIVKSVSNPLKLLNIIILA